MSKTGTVFRNVGAVTVFVLALIFIYKYSTGSFDTNDAPTPEEVFSDEASVTDVSDIADISELEAFLKTLDGAESGATLTDKFDSQTMKLALAELSAYKLSESFSLSKKTVSTPVRVPDEVYGTYSTVFEDIEVDRVQIELYDGMLIVDRGEKRELYSRDGALLSAELIYSPAYRRDAAGAPLFTDGTAYYLLDGGTFALADYDPSNDPRVIDYENTADFASENGGLKAVRADDEEALYALSDAEENLLTDYEYSRIYAFSEGLAAALLPDGSISYIDKTGAVVFEGRESYKNTSDRYVDRVYAVPDTMGPESVGYLYFDNSLVLVREKIVDYVYKEKTISDKSTVLRADGSKLGIPSDYNFVSCADGAVVVEKNGKYGVFTADERWALQPRYDNISPYYEGLAVVSKDGKYGVYDTLGKEILPILFDYISPVSHGRIAAYSTETGFLIFEKQGLTD